MKTQRWNVALALAVCFIAPASAISGPILIRPTTERILVTRPIAWTGYADNSYDYKGVIASWENAVIFQDGIYYLSSPVFGPWPEKAAGRYSIMGEKSLYSIQGEGGWPGLDVKQTLIPSLQVKNEGVN